MLLAGLLLLASCSQAQFYLLEKHEINISVNETGNAAVRERYFLFFQNEQQFVDFQQTKSEIGISIEGWRSYDSRIFPYIGQERDIEVRGISFNEDMGRLLQTLEINYALKEPLMEKKMETSRVIEYGIKTKFFNQFLQGPFLVIPENTTIVIELPRGIKINEPVKPPALIEGSTVTWEGYVSVSGDEFDLGYSLFKQIASFDFRDFLQELVQSDLFLILVAFIAIASLIILVKRKSITNRVEHYIVEHSDLGGTEEED